MVSGSCFGLFFSSDPTGTGTSVTQAVSTLTEEYMAHMQEIEAATGETVDVLAYPTGVYSDLTQATLQYSTHYNFVNHFWLDSSLFNCCFNSDCS